MKLKKEKLLQMLHLMLLNRLFEDPLEDLFNEIYSNTEDDLKKRIVKIIDEKPELLNNLITSNQVKPFKTTRIVLTTPIKYPILMENKYIKSFNQFGISH